MTSPIIRELRKNQGQAQGESSQEQVTCFFLHHAGGSSASFVWFPQHFPAHWRLRAAELPGRGVSMSEPPCRNITEVLDCLLPSVLDAADQPLAIFGHSMGALVGYELARELQRNGRPPVWLGMSGMPSPQAASRIFTERRDLWPLNRLLAFMRELGGTPDEMLQDAATVDYMVKILRRDLTIVDTYEYHPGAVLRMPIGVFWGVDDAVMTAQRREDWRNFTTAPVSFHSLPGGHFYLFDHVEQLSRHIVEEIRAALAAPEPLRGRQEEVSGT